MSTDFSHIPFDRLVDLAEGRLPTEERDQLLAHIASNPQAAAEFAELERMLDLMRSDDMEDAPSYVVSRANRLMRQKKSGEVAQPNLIQRLVALLKFDSAMAPAAAGIRSVQSDVRQMLYSAEGYDIDLRVMPTGDTWMVSGQLLGPSAQGQAMLQGPATVYADLNELSEFNLDGVPSGQYTLTLHLEDVDIDIDSLDIGA